MNMTGIYHIEIIKYVEQYRYGLMYKESQIELCERLNVTPEKLEELLDIAFVKKYLALDSCNHPYIIKSTPDGLAFAAEGGGS